MAEASAKLFERVPRGLFGPLGDRYAELYWELLATLYKCEFEREPFIVLRPVALEIAEQAIRNSMLWATRRAELEEFARRRPQTRMRDRPEEPDTQGQRGGLSQIFQMRIRWCEHWHGG